MFSLEEEPKQCRVDEEELYEKYKKEALKIVYENKELINKTNESQIRRIYNILVDTNNLGCLKVFCEKKLGIDKLKEKKEIDIKKEVESKLKDSTKIYFEIWKMIENGCKGKETKSFLKSFTFEMMLYKKTVESIQNVVEANENVR